MDLTDEQRGVLAVAGRYYRSEGAREQAVRDELGLSATQYAMRLNALLDSPAAVLAFPQLVGRLRRLRDQRVTRRTARRAS